MLVDSTPRFRKGFRRKKGESPYVCDMNVKFKKEKKQSTILNPDPWARLVGSRNTAAIYICRATTRPPRPSSTAECLRLIARLRGEQASAASGEPRPPFEATEMD